MPPYRKKADEDEILISEIYEESPAEQAGLKEGDVLLQADGHAVSGQDLDTVVSWISGEPGTDVELRILRNGEELDVTVTRDVIETKTVEYEMKEDGIGYIRVEEFDKVTYDQFKAALDDLEGQGMNSLIIDLRGNPGGQLTTVTDMLKLFLPEGVIVSTKDKYGNTDEITCDGDHEFKKPLAVLVDGHSASASEIFSAAIQDYDVGIHRRNPDLWERRGTADDRPGRRHMHEDHDLRILHPFRSEHQRNRCDAGCGGRG